MSDDDILKMFNQQNAAVTASQPKKNAGFLGTVLSTVGGIAGGLGGGFLGSVVPVAGTTAGAIGGGAAGSAAGRWLANLLTGTDAGEGVVEDAAFGAVGGGLGKVLKAGKGLVVADDAAKAATSAGANAVGAAPKTGILSRFKTNVGQNIEENGNKLMASQANLTRSQANKMGFSVPETFGNLQKRTGLGDAEDLAKLSSDITGKDSVTKMWIDKAIKPVGVNTDGYMRRAEDILIDRGISKSSPAGKAIIENAKNQGIRMNGGSAGSLSSVVGGDEALKSSRFFGDLAEGARKGARVSGDTMTEQTGKAYQDISNFLNNRLYNAPGLSERFMAPGGAKEQIVKSLRAAAKNEAPDVSPKIKAAYGKLADEFDNVKDIAGARSFQKDFVRLNKIAEKTAQAENGAAQSLMDTKTGLGRFAQRPLNIIAEPLEQLSGKAGAKMADFGRRLQGDVTQVVEGGSEAARKLTKGDLIKSLVAQGIPRAAFGSGGAGYSGQNMNAPIDPAAAAMFGTDPSMLTAEQMSGAGLGVNPDMMGGDPSMNASAPFTKESLDQAIMEAAINGNDTNVAMLMKLGEYYYPQGGGANLSAAGQKSLQSMNAANTTVDNLEAILNQTGGQDNGVLANIFGGVQSFAGGAGLDENARLYESQAGSAATQLARAISGESGAMSDQDIQRAKDMIPKLSDSRQVRAQKLAILRNAIQSNAQSVMQFGGGGSVNDLTAVFGG